MTQPPFPQPVLFAIGGLGRGGSEIQLTRLLEHLGPELTGAGLLFRGPGEEALRNQITLAGVRLLRVPGRINAGPARAPVGAAVASAVVLLLRPRLIYVWLEESTLWLVPCAMLTRVPIVIARRNLYGGPQAQARHPLMGRFQRWLERRATIVTANSAAVAAAALDRGIDPARIRVIPNGHDAVEPPPLPGGSVRTFGYLANFRPEKGHWLLLDALAVMPREFGWRVICSGSGPLREVFAAEVRRRGLDDRLEIITVEDPRDFWSWCDAAVLLSDEEGCPNALIEAALAGRPLVATAVGGSTELIPPGAGRLVEPGNAARAADALAELAIVDGSQLEAMGRRAWEHASSRFSVAAMVAGHREALVQAGARHTS